MTRHLLDIDDLDAGSLARLMELARLDPAPRVLQGKGVALLFEKPSARTRNSSEMAVVDLGGHPVTIRGDEVGIDRRESAEDVCRTMAQYHAVLGARVFDHRILERMAATATVPVVNLLSDHAHPLQAIADLLTLSDLWDGQLSGRRLAWVGDGNNVARSVALACALVGMEVAVATPPGHALDEVTVDAVRALGGSVIITTSPEEAVQDADALSTDVWVSMGQEEETVERLDAFSGYRVDPALMAAARPGARFLHCLPAHRGQEVAAEVIDGPASAVWEQAANRRRAMRGALLWLAEEEGEL